GQRDAESPDQTDGRPEPPRPRDVCPEMCDPDPRAGWPYAVSVRAVAGRAHCALLASSPRCRIQFDADHGGDDPGSRVLPGADQQSAGALLGGDPDPGAGAALRCASSAGQHWATAGDRRVSSGLVLRMAALALGLWRTDLCAVTITIA